MIRLTILYIDRSCLKKKKKKKNFHDFLFDTALLSELTTINLTALRKAKTVCNFGLSECNTVKKGGNNENGRVASPESVTIHVKWGSLVMS